ncbi:MAG TPA: arginine--tRNA ligase [Acidimicrobiales bacterium]|nr:arginine--tRNA ligase [Acidimicrobiales bacterium]
MADPLRTLLAPFATAITRAFGPEYAATDPQLRRSQQAQFGDYQANIAMGMARLVGRSPRDVAQAIVEVLEVDDQCDKVEVAGPGFINLTMRPDHLAAAVAAVAGDDDLGLVRAGTPETVIVDYSGPNVAKEMHVGHLRSTVIGDALVRTLGAVGHRVIRQNHLGDWGTPFGMLIEHLADLGTEAGAPSPSIGDLDAFYQDARAKFEADPAFAERARARVVTLQGGDEPTLALWRALVAESQRHFEAVYRRLGVRLSPEDIRGESFYNSLLDETVEELQASGLLVVDQGALCAFPPGFVGREGQPLPLIVRKSDGGYGYDATDLTGLRFRVRDLDAQRIVYVVDARQSQHFAMVFAVAGQAGWLGEGRRAEHVAFGTVLGPDGRPFKTRTGGTVKLVDLVEEAVERARVVVTENGRELDVAEREAVAQAVGIGALKYADLSSDRLRDYAFDWDRMLSFDGNTAPYLQYARARIRSIFRRAGEEGAGVGAGAVVIAEPTERALALQLLSFDSAVQQSAALLQPHRLCTYLFELASAFTTFYEHCPILRADSDEQRSSRLALCDVTARILARGLDFLGIEAPDRM